MNVVPLNAIGGLPTRNLQSGRFEGAEAISGERLAERLPGAARGLRPLPGGLHPPGRAAHPLPQRPLLLQDLDARLRPRADLSPPAACWASTDVPGMLQLMDEIEVQGLDVMSTGVALAWATEALRARADHRRRRPTAWRWPSATPQPTSRPSSASSASRPTSTARWRAASSTPRRSTAGRSSRWPSAATRCPAITPARPATWAT